MTDPIFLIAVSGLGLSVIVSGIRLVNWFLQSDPKIIAQAGRLSAVGLFALSLPLLLGLAANQRWVGTIGLSAVMLLGFTLYGPRILGQILPRRLVPDFGSPAPEHTGRAPSDSDTELVQRSITVLEEYLRRNAGISAYANLRGGRSQISHARSRGNGNGHDAENRDRGFHDGEPDARSMSEAEALEVLGLDPGATEAEIAESHRRLMQLIHPDRGGSPYFAVKANQAKEVLLGRGKPQNGRSTSAGPRKRRRSLGGGLRQGVFARTRDRVFARRALPLHDEQPARKQLLSL
jgi:hypothetical protein